MQQCGQKNWTKNGSKELCDCPDKSLRNLEGRFCLFTVYAISSTRGWLVPLSCTSTFHINLLF